MMVTRNDFYIVFIIPALWLLIIVVGGCQAIMIPAPVPSTVQPLPVLVDDLLVTADEMPVGWWELFSKDERERWERSGAVDAVVSIFQNNRGGTVTHTVVRLANPDDAETTWRRFEQDRIETALTRYELVPLLSDADLPTMHADRVLLRCEDYGDDTKGCAVRMQYDLIYTEVKADFTSGRISAAEFNQILEAVDYQMKPIWSSSNQEYSPLSVP